MTLAAPPIQFRPLGAQTEPPMARHDIICLHTMVGYLSSTDAMFKRNGYGGTESHFGIGGKWGPSDPVRGLEGVIFQWQDLRHTADANLDGNPRVISIETADNAPKFPKDIEDWTPKQCESIARLVAWLCTPAAHSSCPASWLCHREGIPAVLVPDTKPSRRGIAYHQQGCTPHVVAGGELWSSADGKECPGPRRIRQITTTIIPRVKELLVAIPANPPEDDVTPQDKKDIIDGVVAKLLGQPVDNETTATPGDTVTVKDLLERVDRWTFFASLGAPVGFVTFKKATEDAQWLLLGGGRWRPSKAMSDAVLAAAVTRRNPGDPKVASVVDPRLVVVLPDDDPFWSLPVIDPTAPTA